MCRHCAHGLELRAIRNDLIREFGADVAPSKVPDVMTLPLEAWEVVQLRLTAFALSVDPEPIEDWWRLAAEASPSEATANLRTRSATATGSSGPGQLVLNIQPDRVDWLATADETINPHSTNTVSNLGHPGEVIGWFVPMMERWLGGANLPDMTRIAFGGVFQHPEEDLRSGYSRLPDYVPVRLKPGASDFMYQINHPVISGVVDGLRVNRLTRWAVTLMKVWIVNAEGRPTVSDDIFALRAEFDVNTAPAAAVPPDKLVAVFHELVELATASVEHGVAE